MVHGHALELLGLLDARDDLALLVVAGVAGAREDHGHGAVVLPGELRLVELARIDLEEGVEKVALHAREHDLGLGVAEAGVELEDLRAVLGEHEAAVEAALVHDAVGRELRDDALLDVDHGVVLVLGEEGHGAVDAHAARVGTLVAVERALVVLRGGQGNEGRAVGEGEHRALGAGEGLLDDHGRAGVAEVVEAGMHAGERLVGGLGDDDALARGETVGLDHERAARALDVVGTLLLARKRAVGGRGDLGACHDLLGELLGALHLRRRGVGAKHGDAGGVDRIGDARDERRLRADHHEADAVLAREVRDVDGRALVDVGLLGDAQHAAVAGRDP